MKNIATTTTSTATEAAKMYQKEYYQTHRAEILAKAKAKRDAKKAALIDPLSPIGTKKVTRKRTAKHKRALKKSWTPEKREAARQRMIAFWADRKNAIPLHQAIASGHLKSASRKSNELNEELMKLNAQLVSIATQLAAMAAN